MPNRYLTKSRFTLAVECPTKLFYFGKDSVYRNLKKEDSFLAALAEGGFQVGKMATILYAEGVEVTERGNTEALNRTAQILSQHEDVTIFEPAFQFEGLLVRVDILVKKGDRVELIEVKAKSYDSVNPRIAGKKVPIVSDMRPYIEDVAFQRYVVANAMPRAKLSCYLLMPDKSVPAVVDGLNQCFKIKKLEGSTEVVTLPDAAGRVAQNASLLAKVPVDQYVDIVMNAPLAFPGSKGGMDDHLAVVVKRWAAAYQTDTKITPVLQKNCATCEFREPSGGSRESGYHECLAQAGGLTPTEVDQGTVLDIWNYRKKDDLISRGILRMDQVREDDINVKADKFGLSTSQRQWLQVRGIPREHDKGGFYFDTDYMLTRMRQWRYPLHMIDFETCTVALPFFQGMRPYESVAFQFSHHVMHDDGRIEHKDQALIAAPGEFPNFKFVRALKASLENDDGSIFRWAAHENTILRHIKEQLLAAITPPADCGDLIKFIEQITDDGPRSMIDLNEFALRAFFHPRTKARTSIKQVLPAVMTVSKYLEAKYSRPVYGSEIRSLNFSEGFVWHEKASGLLKDPYERLKALSVQMLGEEGADALDAPEDVEIAEGGAAAMAYARLQFEDLNPDTRERIKQALLRYCELDTFAMVMIVEAWREWALKLQ